MGFIKLLLGLIFGLPIAIVFGVYAWVCLSSLWEQPGGKILLSTVGVAAAGVALLFVFLIVRVIVETVIAWVQNARETRALLARCAQRDAERA